MPFLFINDYSFHEQFATSDEVIDAVRRLWGLCKVSHKYSAEFFCSRYLLGKRLVIPGITLRDVVIGYPKKDIRGLILSWLDKNGPYWDMARLHNEDEWYFAACCGVDEQLVTDSAVAECTARVLLSESAGLLSVTPSDFTFTPVRSGTRNDVSVTADCELQNYWGEAPLRQFLEDSISVSSWTKLRDYAMQRFQFLIFAKDAFTYLDATPFSTGLRDRIVFLLDTLNRLSAETHALSGALTTEGQARRDKFFVGKKALFTDSSISEKRTFASGLTFLCPVRGEKKLFSWHGKAKMGDQYRIHFAWPKPDPAQRLPVVYIGPKITKR